ncbi:MAG TPA: hypothetical protein VMS75_07845 [Terriglobales bacterium]|nr:hypothetical protein [Terriglobales bacterium]
MKQRALVILFLFLAAAVGMAHAQTGRAGGNTGLGIIFGEPTGVSFKYWTGRTVAMDAAAAWSFVNGGSFQFHTDILFHSFDIFRVEKGRMALYYGFGGRFKTKTDTDRARLSFRVPIGISYEFERAPVELFVEIAPMLDLTPKTEGNLGGGIGFRYYF